MRDHIAWLIALASIGLSQNWEIRSVPPEMQAAYDPKIATDSLCLPHIALGYVGLSYANWTGDNWDFAYVDTSGPLLDMDFCLDGDDVPHIGYAISRWPEPGEVRYAYRCGNTWRVETAVADCTPRWLKFSALALARDLTPHMVFKDSATIKYTYKTADTWNVLTVPAYQADSLRRLIGATIALDTSDRPGIAVNWCKSGYYDSLWFTFFEYDSAGWHRFDVDSVHVTVGGYFVPRVRSDPATDLFHIMYTSGTYAIGRDSNWQLKAAPVPDAACALVLHQGQPHIASGASDLPVEYTWRTVDGWEDELVSPFGTVGDPSIAVDRTGRPHMAFVSAEDWSLHYARRLFAGTEEPAPAIVRPTLGLMVNPNPAPHAFTLEFPVRSPSTAAIRLCDALGRTVWSQEEKAAPGRYRRRLTLPASISPGVYFLQVLADSQRNVEKVILQ